jgi:hypothetical protein
MPSAEETKSINGRQELFAAIKPGTTVTHEALSAVNPRKPPNKVA